jgi:hypothetical protein
VEVLIAKLLEWGPVPALLVLTFVIVRLIKKLDENAASDSKRADEFRKSLKDHMDETDKRFAEHADRMACIERDYLTRESHYKDIGGWRTDLNNLRSDIGADLRGVRQEMAGLASGILTTALKGKQNGN